MMKCLSAALIVALAMLHLSCKRDDGPCTTCPPPPKDPRTYSWTVDTISYPGSFQTLMNRVWASGPENVYIVGHNDQAFGKMFHFDGTRWTDVRLNQSQGGAISPPIGVLNAIYGFGPNDIYAVGERYGNPPTSSDSSVIIHFDGVEWHEQGIQPQRAHRLQSLWGATSTDIWAGGTNVLVHYDGVQWSHFQIELPGQGIQFFSMSGLSSSDVYMMGWRPDVTSPNDTTAYLLYHFDGSSWGIIDSMIQVLGTPPLQFGTVLGNVTNELYSVRFGVFRKETAGWHQLFSANEPLLDVSGTRRTNLFAVGLSTQLWQYNGSDWYRYPQFPNSSIDFYSAWASSDQVFIVGHDGLRTFVARGK